MKEKTEKTSNRRDLASEPEANLARGWTSREIADRLGISSAVFQKRVLGAQEIALIREAGITHLEISGMPRSFDYRDRRQVSEIKAACKKQGVEIVSCHTSIFPFGSGCEKERKEAVREALFLARTAAEMGVSILSCHLSTDEQAQRSIADMLEALEDIPLTLAVENVGGVSIRDAMSLVDEIGSDRFKMLLDIGHERDADGVNPFVKIEGARAAVTQCKGYLSSVHLHETFAVEQKPDHRAPLHEDGIIAWGEVFAGLKDAGYRGALVFEDGRGENPEEWVQATGAFPAKFVARYGTGLSQ